MSQSREEKRILMEIRQIETAICHGQTSLDKLHRAHEHAKAIYTARVQKKERKLARQQAKLAELCNSQEAA